MKKGNWHRRPSVVLQFLQATVSGVGLGLLDGLGVLLVLEDPGDAEHGCSKSPEAMSAQLEVLFDMDSLLYSICHHMLI